MMEDFQTRLRSHTAEVEEIIKSFLPKEEGRLKTLLSAMNYSFLVGGKRLRPMLMLETYRLFGGDDPAIRNFMAAIEMIHTYSLIHDDLPAMDNDEYRRGKKTTWVKYGEDIAVLAGDGLLNMAFEIAIEGGIAALEMDRGLYALRVMAKKAGVYGMIGGQTVDVENEGKQLNLETLEFIHRNKTSALIEASMVCGAIIGGSDEATARRIETAAGDIGLAFQIRDDILDVIGEEEKLGTPIGSDEKNEHMTYVSMVGLEKANQRVKDLSEQAMQIIADIPHENPFLMELLRSLIEREY